MVSQVIPVEGMSCGGCSATLQGKLSALPGMQQVQVSFDDASASVEFDGAQLTTLQILQAIGDAGFEVPDTAKQALARAPESVLASIRFPVAGMSCAGCAAGIATTLNGLSGVSDASVNYALSSAEVQFDPQQLSAAQLADAVSAAGFEPALSQTTLQIAGMSCAGCSAAVEKALAKAPGVVAAEVNLALEKATITTLGAADVAQLQRTVEDAGYSASVPAVAGQPVVTPALPLWQQSGFQLAVAVLLSAPMVLQMLLGWLGVAPFLPHWLEWLLATPVQFWIGARFYRGAWRALRAGTGNMDVLVVMGTSAAYLFSLYLWARGHGGHLYFESAAVVITLVLLGKWLESRAKQSASAAIRSLLDLRPETVTLLQHGQPDEVSIASARVGDLMLVRPGERVALDGLIEQGSSDIDESMLTGESLPVMRSDGDRVTGGSMNGSGALQVRITAVGADTTLARVIEIVEKAQAGKAPIQRLVDKVSALFVPVVLAIAAVTLLGWLLAGAGFEQALVAAVTVLVIACPCALGLATPTALVAGTGVAARHGILIKDIDTLERANGITRVIFDKTGTLTEGRPVVTQLQAADQNRALQLAASLQSQSEHPLARAVVQMAEQQSLSLLPVSDFRAVVGAGVEGRVDHRALALGNAAFALSHGAVAGDWQQSLAAQERAGQTAVALVCDGEVIATFAFADAVRGSSRDAVDQLKAQQVAVALLSGDAPDVTANIAGKLGIADWQAGLKPQDKSDAVSRWRSAGERVAMVGDGINDAPALAAADIGIAMGSGTDVAIETAGITLMRNEPTLVPAALEIARATRRKIRQNLFWAFIYNVIGLPLAAMGVLTPTLAGAAMAMSSVSVVSNALLLKRWQPKQTAAPNS